jgi:predicted secreted Zn-dependent protease
MPIPPLKLIAYSSVAALITAVVAPQSLRDADDLRVDITREYYQVTGRNWPDVWQEIERIKVRPEGAKAKFEGVTALKLDLEPKEGCSANNSSIKLALVVNQPVVGRMTRLNKESETCWTFYERRLAEHEDFHIEIAVHNAKELIGAIRSSGSESCSNLQTLTQRRFDQMRAAQDRYDNTTVSGIRQWNAELDYRPDTTDEAMARQCMTLRE